jgi:hypothetical protein
MTKFFTNNDPNDSHLKSQRRDIRTYQPRPEEVRHLEVAGRTDWSIRKTATAPTKLLYP